MAGRENRKKQPRLDEKLREREKRVFELWKEGSTLREIGLQLNISHEQARKDRMAELERRRTEDDEAHAHWQTLQLARLHDQYRLFNELAKGKVIDEKTGERKPNIEAGRLVIRILNQISELTGVKAAVKHEITGAGGGPIYVTSSIDLSQLSKEELLQYEQLLTKANSPNVKNA